VNALETPLTKLKGVGPYIAQRLEKVDIRTIGELLYYIPRRYDDFSKIVPIKSASLGAITIKGTPLRVSAHFSRKGIHMSEAEISDGTASLKALWFRAPYIKEQLLRDTEYYFSGSVERVGRSFALVHPTFEKVSDFQKNTARIVPVYSETKDVSSRLIRRVVAVALDYISSINELLPPLLVARQRLIPREQALREVHYPPDLAQAQEARDRLAFDELFVLMLAEKRLRGELDESLAPAIAFDENLAKQVVASLPFELTADQKRVAWTVLQDLERTRPSNRLIQGDVGSGKTVVAAFAATMALQAGQQVALMAPTEVLARQHAQTFHDLLTPLGLEKEVSLLIGSIKLSQKKTLQERIANQETRLVIGTHALIQKGVTFPRLGLVIVDEQHRFGVRQRQALLATMADKALVPHLLSMTATPIPRTLALTLYGDLDISSIRTMPAGRKPVETHVVSLRERAAVYVKVEQLIEAGQQAYIICPLVEDSDVLGVKSVTAEYERLQKTVFAHRRIGLLHGKLKSTEKEKVLKAFSGGEIDILVTTTVVEVGVNVPNATILLIEGAERFGLSQLHQLRGRVGRSEKQSYCYLLTTNDTSNQTRLRYLESTHDGFKLAQYDLELRGPGQLHGTLQHGDLDLRIADLSDAKLIEQAQVAVKLFIEQEDLTSYPELSRMVEKRLSAAHQN
jgi:ATP-dependent DNA helicase RecG